MKFLQKLKAKFKSKKHTRKLPTVFIERKQKDQSLSAKHRLKKISKRSFPKNAPINLLGKLFKLSRWIWLTVILGAFIASAYAVFFTEVFIIKKVLIFESEIESSNVQIRKIADPLRNGNLFLFSKEELAESIRKRANNLTNLTITRKIPDTVIIKYEKFKDVANIANLIGPAQVKKSFIINEIGILTEQDKISTSLPTISVFSDKAYLVGDQIINTKDLKYILDAKNHYQEKFDMKIIETRYLPKPQEIRLVTERNFQIWLDIVVPYAEQFNKLKNAIPKINIYDGPLEYVDLRIQSAQGQKIIYK